MLLQSLYLLPKAAVYNFFALCRITFFIINDFAPSIEETEWEMISFTIRDDYKRML